MHYTFTPGRARPPGSPRPHRGEGLSGGRETVRDDLAARLHAIYRVLHNQLHNASENTRIYWGMLLCLNE